MYSINISLGKIKTKLRFKYNKKFQRVLKNSFWFMTGAILSLSFFLSIAYFGYQKIYENKVYPGISIANINFGSKSQEEIEKYFNFQNEKLDKIKLEFSSDYGTATVSAKDIKLGYDSKLLAQQAIILGRSKNIFSNFTIILQSYFTGINLKPAYTYSVRELDAILKPLVEKVEKDPVNAVFKFETGRVKEFTPSENGRKVDDEELDKIIREKIVNLISNTKHQTIKINIPIKTIEPEITTEKANDLGIKELIGVGRSRFGHSIPSRIYNVNLASSRISGVLVAPGETFSFDKTLGDISSFTGYKQAYIISGGRTILGDGGGVCQVSTTFFRAVLNAGLPIVERHAHAYRVGYYEQDSPPGIDATIYVPTVDFKFKNDTEHYILIQREIDLKNLTLAFYLYGTKDGREVTITKPVILSQSPPPEPLYQDDPNLPVGEIQQIDYAAWGAKVYFTRTVKQNGKTIIDEKFSSNYQPWRAVYLKGTKSE